MSKKKKAKSTKEKAIVRKIKPKAVDKLIGKHWNETIASGCRYGKIAGRIWGDWEIIWEDSEADYQGHASILARKDGKYSFYEWWYGSCSGCDGWEAQNASDADIEKEMRETAIWFDNLDELRKWAEMLEGKTPISNASMERGGGLAFGIDFLSSGLIDRLNAIRAELGIPPISEKE
jgi:hypothetical protein